MSNNKQNENNNAKHQFSNTEPLTHAQKIAVANKMSNNKQGSVKWLFEQVCNLDWKNIQGEKKLEILEQAKAMHKEEVTSFTADWSIQYKYENGKNINQFYYETFGGNNEQQ
jgi:hypothetical protein